MAERTGNGGYGPQYETERGYSRPRWDYDRESMRRESQREDDYYQRGEWSRFDQESGYGERPRSREREEYRERERQPRRREERRYGPQEYRDPRYGGGWYEASPERRDELSRRFGTYDWDRESERERQSREWRGNEYGREGMWGRQQGEAFAYGSGAMQRGFGQQGPYVGKGPRGYTRSDDRICEEICEILTRHPNIDAEQIEVEVAEGRVNLKGSTPDRNQKHMVEDIAEQVTGVREVSNQVRVGSWAGQQGSSARTEVGPAQRDPFRPGSGEQFPSD